MSHTNEKHIPGPSVLSLLKNTKKLRNDPLSFGKEIIDKYGNAIKIRLGPYKVIALNDPAYHHYVLKENWTNYPKGKAFEKMEPLMGNGLLMAENDFWRQNRSIVQPAFRLNRMQSYFEEVVNSSNNLFSTWSDKSSLDFHQEMMTLTLSVISKCLFQLDQGKGSVKISEAIHDFMAGMEDQIFHLFSFQKHLPNKVNKKFKASVKYLDGVVYKIIEERRIASEGKNDLISMLINASKNEGAKGISDKYLRDEIMNFFIGGHETSANALTWCLYNLSNNQDVLDKLIIEIKNVLAGQELKYEHLDKFHYLDQVINESLRMYPPIWIISRETKEDDVIDGMKIPKGSIMVVSPYFLHRRKDIWNRPEVFNPDRFSQEEINKRPKNSFLPFGLGPRSCIGEMFARMEMKTILIILLSRFQFNRDDTNEVIPLATITLRPKNGLKIYIKEKVI